MGDLVIRDRSVVPEPEVRAEQPIRRAPEDDHRAKPALSRLRQLGPHAFHVLRAAQLCLARRSKALAIVRRTNLTRVRQRGIGDDGPNPCRAQRRAIPPDVIDGTREPTASLRFERLVERPSRTIAEERDVRFVSTVRPRRFAVDEGVDRSLRGKQRGDTSAQDAPFW